LIRLDLDADDVVADEVLVGMFCGISEMAAHGRAHQRLDFGRRHPADRAEALSPAVEQG
jgi:hypothetical protein